MKRRNSVGAWAFVISSLFILSSCSQIGGNSVDNENSSMSSEPAPLSILNENGINYITHAPFRINSDAELAAMAASEGWAGDGTQGNPYIIENYDINGSVAGCCVFIGNTTKYLKVRNCYFHDANNSNEWDYHRNAGLFLYYTIQAMVENNNLSLNYYGLFLQYSGSSTNYYIANNTAENNYRSGLYIWSKDYNAVKQGFIINNTVVNNHGCGIELYETYSTILSGNNATGNGWDGIRLQNSRSSNIAGNIALNNTGAGISCIYNSWSDTIENNTVSGNNIGICIDDYSTDAWVGNNIVSANGKGIEVGIACYSSKVVNNTVSYNGDGIYLDNAQDCTIYHNSLIENVAQAYDSWGYYHRNMWSDSYPSGGNYWSDYTGLDMMQGQDQNIPGFDGIGDTPYSEIRWENEMDHFPLMRPWSEVFYAAKIPYAQIRINNNSEFDAAHGVSAGNGTVWSPWIIENYDINGTGYGYCIFVGNTTDYFKIKNCWLHEANGHSGAWFWNTALTLYNAQNGYVVGNYVNKSEYGQLLVSYSVNNTLTFNYCTENTFALGVESYFFEQQYLLKRKPGLLFLSFVL
jgi:parallel beta-helix repeat protein